MYLIRNKSNNGRFRGMSIVNQVKQEDTIIHSGSESNCIQYAKYRERFLFDDEIVELRDRIKRK